MKRLAAGLLTLLAALAPARAEEAKAITVPFELLRSKHMAIQVKINGKGPYRMIFDTGAPVTLINNKVAKEAGVLPKDFKPPAFALFGAAGQFQVETLQVGGVKAHKVPAIVMDHPTVQLISKVLGPIEGLVGFPFFARYKTTIDYQAKTLTFVPNGYQPKDVLKSMMQFLTVSNLKPAIKVLAPAAQWGFQVEKGAKDEEAGVAIKQVLAGSPAAAAGLQPEDRLLSLDDHWTDSVTECYAAAAKVKPGREVKVTIVRKGQELTLTVKPVSGL